MARRLSRQGERALDAANELVERAWAETDRDERRALAEQALLLSPLCAYAHGVLAELAGRTTPEAITHWRRAVTVGATALGPAGFREMAALRSRPAHADAYCDALGELADALWETGARAEAIMAMLRGLETDPRDEYGIRYRLLGWFIEEGRDEEARLILVGSQRDGESTWPWAAALLRFRSHGADENACDLLRDALVTNDNVAPRLLGLDRVPDDLKGEVDSAQAIDAALVAGALEDAWTHTPGALDWLAAELPGLMQAIATADEAEIPPEAP